MSEPECTEQSSFHDLISLRRDAKGRKGAACGEEALTVSRVPEPVRPASSPGLG